MAWHSSRPMPSLWLVLAMCFRPNVYERLYNVHSIPNGPKTDFYTGRNKAAYCVRETVITPKSGHINFNPVIAEMQKLKIS
jgi:hypothetical protein